jgi:hypothetical protein
MRWRMQGYVIRSLLSNGETDPKRELTKVTKGLKQSETRERELADELSEIEQVDVGANLAELRNVRNTLRKSYETNRLGGQG